MISCKNLPDSFSWIELSIFPHSRTFEDASQNPPTAGFVWMFRGLFKQMQSTVAHVVAHTQCGVTSIEVLHPMTESKDLPPHPVGVFDDSSWYRIADT